jgi:two-component system OmpR family response regulator
MSKHVAIVEDEDAIAQNYIDALRRQHYKVSHFRNRQEATAAFATRLPDLVIIDVGLGHEVEGGFELCRQLRTQSAELPIIFLTALDSEFDVVSGLRLGADDYLTKDISLPHMLARITALFRRIESISTSKLDEAEIVHGFLRLNLDRMRAYWREQAVDLTVTELWIISALAKHPGHVKNRQQLMDAANVVLDDNTITSHIKRIRKKFREIDSAFNSIQTAYGMGYRWVSEEQSEPA